MKNLKAIKNHALSVLSIVGFIFLWQLGSQTRILPVDYMGIPSKIFVEFLALFNSKTFFTYVLPSLQALVFGLVLALLIGSFFGFVIGMSPTVRKMLQPLLFGLNSIPAIVFFPFIIIGLGIGLQSAVLTIVLMCFVPIMINVIEGIGSTDPSLITMAKSFGAGRAFIYTNVVFYSTLPFIFAGAKSAIGKSMIALIVAELYGLNKGIGYLISYYGSTFQANKLMSIVLLIVIVNGILFFILRSIENSLRASGYRKEML